MEAILNGYRCTIFYVIVLIALGVIFSTILKDVNSAIGTVFIAIGGLFFIIGMNKKGKKDKVKKIIDNEMADKIEAE